MNVYVREVARALGRLGFEMDVFTRSQDAAIPEVVPLGPGRASSTSRRGRPVRSRGPRVAEHLDAFAERVEAFRRREGCRYDLRPQPLLALGARWARPGAALGRPLVHMFHTLGAIKNAVARGSRRHASPRSGWPPRCGSRGGGPHRGLEPRRAGGPGLAPRRRPGPSGGHPVRGGRRALPAPADRGRAGAPRARRRARAALRGPADAHQGAGDAPAGAGGAPGRRPRRGAAHAARGRRHEGRARRGAARAPPARARPGRRRAGSTSAGRSRRASCPTTTRPPTSA